MSSDFELAGCK